MLLDVDKRIQKQAQINIEDAIARGDYVKAGELYGWLLVDLEIVPRANAPRDYWATRKAIKAN